MVPQELCFGVSEVNRFQTNLGDFCSLPDPP